MNIRIRGKENYPCLFSNSSETKTRGFTFAIDITIGLKKTQPLGLYLR